MMNTQTMNLVTRTAPEGEDLVVREIECEPTATVMLIAHNILVLDGQVQCDKLSILASGSVIFLPRLISPGTWNVQCTTGKVINGQELVSREWITQDLEILAAGPHIFLGASGLPGFTALLGEEPIPPIPNRVVMQNEAGSNIIVTECECEPTDDVEIIGHHVLILCGAVKCSKLTIRACGSVVFLPQLVCRGALIRECRNGEVVDGMAINHPRQPSLWEVDEAEIIADGLHIFQGATRSVEFSATMILLDVPIEQTAAIFGYIDNQLYGQTLNPPNQKE